MAKNRIKGIVIEIGGETTALQKSLKEVDDKLNVTQTNLKDINKLLKIDPKNTELLRQKQENLNKAVADTKERLKTLKNAYKELDGKNTEEAKQQQEALSREIFETEHNLKSLEEQYKNFGSVAKQQLKAVGDELKEVGGKVTDAGKTLTTRVTAPIVALGAIGINYNAQIEQYRTMFTTLTGSAEEADRIISQLQEDAQKSPFDSASLIQANQYLISAGVEADEARQTILNLGNAVAATGGGSSELERMAQNLQQIKNVGKATSQDIKQFANAGINIYGLLAEATGKNVEEVKDMDVSYELLSDALAKASAEGGKYYGAMEAQGQTLNGSLSATKESIQMLLGEITRSAMPVIVQILGKVRDAIKWLSSLSDRNKKLILTVGAVVGALGPALTILGTMITFVGSLVSGIGMLMNPITLVIGGIGLLAGAVSWLNANMETLRAVASNVWTRFKSDLGAVVSYCQEKIDWIASKFSALKSAISNAFDFSSVTDRIKNFFNSFSSQGFDYNSNFRNNRYDVINSGGFMSSGGMMAGGITVNNTFTIHNANSIDKSTVLSWADILTDRINENLGRMV